MTLGILLGVIISTSLVRVDEDVGLQAPQSASFVSLCLASCFIATGAIDILVNL